MPDDFKIPTLDDEEIVVGVHAGTGIQLQEGMNTSLGRNYCANCKRNIHCYVKVDRETNEAIIHKTCKNNDCECKCKTHYACKQCGYLHPYATECNRSEQEQKSNSKNDAAFNELMEKWRKQSEKDPQLVKKPTKDE